MNTIYVVVRYRDTRESQAFLLSRAFTHREEAMRFIQAMGVQSGTNPQFQPTPPDALYDASVLGSQGIRVALIPVKLDIGTRSITPPTIDIPPTEPGPVVPVQSTIPIVTGPGPVIPQLGREPLVIQDSGTYWYVSGGNTYTKRNQLKNLGGRWNPNAKIWMVPKINTSAIALRQLLA